MQLTEIQHRLIGSTLNLWTIHYLQLTCNIHHRTAFNKTVSIKLDDPAYFSPNHILVCSQLLRTELCRKWDAFAKQEEMVKKKKKKEKEHLPLLMPVLVKKDVDFGSTYARWTQTRWHQEQLHPQLAEHPHWTSSWTPPSEQPMKDPLIRGAYVGNVSTSFVPNCFATFIWTEWEARWLCTAQPFSAACIKLCTLSNVSWFCSNNSLAPESLLFLSFSF